MIHAKERNPDQKELRLSLALSQAGVCSRRQADKLIADGRVTVNGAVVWHSYTRVSSEDQIAFDGEAITRSNPARIWRCHKPRGVLTTRIDPQGRRTLFQILPESLPRVISIGRLDFNSEGLILLTTSGQISRYVSAPETAWVRRYRVRVFGQLPLDLCDEIAGGVTISGIKYAPVRARVESVRGGNAWLSVAITEGKNREIRRVFEHYGLMVCRLIRVSFGPFQLGHLPSGGVAEIPQSVLCEQFGSTWDSLTSDN